jgi:hypothetical protein
MYTCVENNNKVCDLMERILVFTVDGKKYVMHDVGGVSLLIPSKTNSLSPFQEDFITAFKKGYKFLDYKEDYWGLTGNHDYGDLVKGVYEFLQSIKL